MTSPTHSTALDANAVRIAFKVEILAQGACGGPSGRRKIASLNSTWAVDASGGAAWAQHFVLRLNSQVSLLVHFKNYCSKMSLIALSKFRPQVQRAVQSQGTRAMTVLSKESGEEYKKLNYTSRAKKTGRPVSPHVTIYAFPVGAISSITNRVTGVALSVGAFGIGGIELLAGSGSSLALMQSIGGCGFLVSAGAKFCVTYPIIYHYLGAVRHLAWDRNPDMLENADVEKASIALLAASGVISTGFMFL
eukprot:Nitzschia sp. Nitz4//scaffold46_size129759//112040//112970//NITZ4_003523-RA/size129759-augustus-gene-0.14-mRNA-1//1//CDS//3329552661//8888//frame0